MKGAKLGALGLVLMIGLVAALPGGCRSEPATSDAVSRPLSAASARLDFRRIQVEIRLARADTPYFVIAPARGRLEIKLKGALVWECPLVPDSGQEAKQQRFFERFAGTDDIVCRPLEGRHVYAYAEQLPDSILAMVAEASGFSPDLIQREIPERMFLLWGGGLLLELVTEIDGRKKSRLDNALFDVQRTIVEVGRPPHPVYRTTPDAAMTLARLATVGMFTVVDPSE